MNRHLVLSLRTAFDGPHGYRQSTKDAERRRSAAGRAKEGKKSTPLHFSHGANKGTLWAFSPLDRSQVLYEATYRQISAGNVSRVSVLASSIRSADITASIQSL